MKLGRKLSTWIVSLRLAANFAPWMVALRTARDIAAQVWSSAVFDVTAVPKVVFFALVGVLVTWWLPPHSKSAGLGTNLSWLLRIAITIGLWVIVFDRLWTIISTLWMGDGIGNAFIIYTAALVVVAYIVNRVWMPRDVMEILK